MLAVEQTSLNNMISRLFHLLKNFKFCTSNAKHNTRGCQAYVVKSCTNVANSSQTEIQCIFEQCPLQAKANLFCHVHENMDGIVTNDKLTTCVTLDNTTKKDIRHNNSVLKTLQLILHAARKVSKHHLLLIAVKSIDAIQESTNTLEHLNTIIATADVKAKNQKKELQRLKTDIKLIHSSNETLENEVLKLKETYETQRLLIDQYNTLLSKLKNNKNLSSGQALVCAEPNVSNYQSFDDMLKDLSRYIYYNVDLVQQFEKAELWEYYGKDYYLLEEPIFEPRPGEYKFNVNFVQYKSWKDEEKNLEKYQTLQKQFTSKNFTLVIRSVFLDTEVPDTKKIDLWKYNFYTKSVLIIYIYFLWKCDLIDLKKFNLDESTSVFSILQKTFEWSLKDEESNVRKSMWQIALEKILLEVNIFSFQCYNETFFANQSDFLKITIAFLKSYILHKISSLCHKKDILTTQKADDDGKQDGKRVNSDSDSEEDDKTLSFEAISDLDLTKFLKKQNLDFLMDQIATYIKPNNLQSWIPKIQTRMTGTWNNNYKNNRNIDRVERMHIFFWLALHFVHKNTEVFGKITNQTAKLIANMFIIFVVFNIFQKKKNVRFDPLFDIHLKHKELKNGINAIKKLKGKLTNEDQKLKFFFVKSKQQSASLLISWRLQQHIYKTIFNIKLYG